MQSPLFIDVETISSVANYEELSPRMQQLWLQKAERLGARTDQEKHDMFFKKGGIFAEFGRIIVIAVGYIIKNQEGQEELHIKGLADKNEKKLLENFKTFLSKLSLKTLLCGHNIKEFDIPYLCRRMTVHSIPLPKILDISGKKPWEVTHLDTMDLWRFGDYKNYTSLDLLTAIFNIPSSKDGISGSDVNTYYYEKKDLNTIEKYCIKDVVATVQLYRKLKFLPLIDNSIIKEHLSFIKARPNNTTPASLPLF